MSEIKNTSNPTTVENAMTYVDTPAVTFSNWKIKDLGLQFLLFGIAELNAKRVVRLAEKVYELEEIVFDEDNLRQLDPKGVLSAYKMGTDALKEATEYISKTRKEMNWDAIQAQLKDMNSDDEVSTENFDMSKIANKLIEAMAHQKDDNDDEPE